MENEMKIFSMKELMEMPDPEETKPDNPLTLENIQQRFEVLRWVFKIAEEHKRSEWSRKCKVYNALKNIVSEFVGWYGTDKNYATSQAFDIVTDKILDIMRM